MDVPNVEPLTWPSSGMPPEQPNSGPLIIYVMIVLMGVVLTFAFNHPAPLFAAAGLCGIVFSVADRVARRPVVVHVRQQLLARPECLQTWASETDPQRLELGATLCDAVARAKKWPNARFIPQDPVALAFFEVSGVDGHHAVFDACTELAKKIGGKPRLHDFTEIAKTRTPTLGDLLDAARAG